MDNAESQSTAQEAAPSAPELEAPEGPQASPEVDISPDVAVPGYVAVPPALIQGDEPLDFALYRKQEDSTVAEYHAAGQPFTNADRAALTDENVKYLYISKAEYDRYRSRVEAHYARLLTSGQLGESRFDLGYQYYIHRIEADFARLLTNEQLGESRFEMAYQVAVQLAGEILENPSQELIDRIISLTEQVAQAVSAADDVLVQWLARRSCVYQTTSHMVNVCLLALLFAKPLEVAEADRAKLAAAMLLHDLGKAGIPESLLCKEGRLCQSEWQLTRSHALSGADTLKQFLRLDPSAAEVAALHHERLDGQGYPKGLAGEAIHPWARLCAVVDLFDRLTSHQQFRGALSPRKAALLIKNDGEDRFDPKMTELLHKLVKDGVVDWPTHPPAGQEPPAAPKASQAGDNQLPLESYLPLPPTKSAASWSPTAALGEHRGQDNRRNYPRYGLKMSCRIRYARPGAVAESHISFWVNAVDISRGGMKFHHTAPMRLGEIVSIFLPDGGNGRHVRAMIVRCQRNPNGLCSIGARFDFGR